MAATVKIYTTPNCSHCMAAKRYFGQRGVEYQELDVSADARARVEMFGIAQTRSVPVIVVGNHVLVGFEQNLARIEQLLAD